METLGRAAWRPLLCATILLVFDAPARARQVPPGHADLEHLSTADGLSHDNVYALAEDPRGFLWLATENGLSRYDGYGFEIYRHDPFDPASLSESDVNSLYVDRGGILWIGTWGGGLNAFDPRTKTFQHFRHEPDRDASLSGHRVQALFEDRAGDLWAGTYRHGLNRLDRETGRFQRFRHDPMDPASLPHDHVWALAEDREGFLWVGTSDGLGRLDRATGKFTNFRHDPRDPRSLSHSKVRALYTDRSGSLWIATEGGINILEPSNLENRRVPVEGADDSGQRNETFKDVLEDRHGRFWLATRTRGLLRFDPETGDLSAFAHNPSDPGSLRHNDVRALLEDRSGNLWVGTRGGGVSKLDLKPRKFHHVKASSDDPNGLSSNRVLALLEASDGALWIGTSEGLDRLDRERNRLRTYRHAPEDPTSLGGGIVRALFEDRGGELWVGTDGGLSRLDRNSGTFARYGREPVRTIASATSTGHLWIGTDGAGLHRLNADSGAVEVFRHDAADATSLSYDRVLALLEDGDGLWIGTGGGGLNRRREASGSTFERFRNDREEPGSLSNDNVTALHRDARGTLWVGTHGGLNRLEPHAGSFRTFTTRDGLPDNFIYGILEDDAGNLWLTTNDGLARFDPRTGKCRTYDLDDGLQGSSFNEGALFRAPGGEMFVGGSNGFNHFHPEKIQDNTHVPEVVVTGFQIFGEDVDLGRAVETVEEIALGHQDSIFSFQFAALDLTAPSRNRYAYTMEGLNDKWIPANERRATFTNLDPGEYVFRVKASNNDGLWNEEGAAIEVTIAPAPWRTWWFQGLLVFLFIASLGGAHLLRIRAVHRRNRQLEEIVARRTAELRAHSEELEVSNEEVRRFAYLVSHDLRSPLISIRGFAGELEDGLASVVDKIGTALGALDPGDAERVRAFLETEAPEGIDFIDSSARRMESAINSILEIARLGQRQPELGLVSLSALVERVLQNLRHLSSNPALSIDIGPMPDLVTDRFLMERILENLLSNALKYLDPARPGRVGLTAELKSGDAVIRVSDNGRGIGADDLGRVFEPFRRVGAQTVPGEGLGLAYVRAMVRQLRGRVECRSVLGQGTTFTLTVPGR